MKFSSTRVLVADDSQMIRTIMQKALRRIGFEEIDVVENGRAALSVLQAESETDNAYGLVVSDIIMPEMTGIEFLEEVRKQEKFKNLPFIICSADSDSARIVKALKIGANGYLVKPIAEGDLENTLRKIRLGNVGLEKIIQELEEEIAQRPEPVKASDISEVDLLSLISTAAAEMFQRNGIKRLEINPPISLADKTKPLLGDCSTAIELEAPGIKGDVVISMKEFTFLRWVSNLRDTFIYTMTPELKEGICEYANMFNARLKRDLINLHCLDTKDTLPRLLDSDEYAKKEFQQITVIPVEMEIGFASIELRELSS